MTGPEWRSIHVHLPVRQDEFVTQVLRPVVADLRRAAVLERWFFLRYWQGGPHVRVRLHGAPDQVEHAAQRAEQAFVHRLRGWEVATSTEQFVLEVQPVLAALESEQADPLHPPLTVRRERYDPEFGKYGGPLGVAAAERYFEVSSDVAGEQMSAGTAPARRLGHCLSAMVRGYLAWYGGSAGMASFFRRYSELWSPYVFDSFLDGWPELWRARREAVTAHLGRLLEDGTARDPLSAAMLAVAAAHRSRPEILEEVTLLGHGAGSRRRSAAVLTALLHTHNNRVGLIPEQEAFLGFLLSMASSAPGGGAREEERVEALLCGLRQVRRTRLARTGVLSA